MCHPYIEGKQYTTTTCNFMVRPRPMSDIGAAAKVVLVLKLL